LNGKRLLARIKVVPLYARKGDEALHKDLKGDNDRHTIFWSDFTLCRAHHPDSLMISGKTNLRRAFNTLLGLEDT
jgi:hypothetical protein